ncbi:CLUMA_CG002707, isoform A [Clunio marinus]|uniref:CLUMA_CG002707, isoform A n=1 Tax=Clunio marinus TaxID=568069 RepID=A0A1J1HLJ8_9DIPT|nr:CLUMA_CG002707, isoform A [Clunio marinus]
MLVSNEYFKTQKALGIVNKYKLNVRRIVFGQFWGWLVLDCNDSILKLLAAVVSPLHDMVWCSIADERNKVQVEGKLNLHKLQHSTPNDSPHRFQNVNKSVCSSIMLNRQQQDTQRRKVFAVMVSGFCFPSQHHTHTKHETRRLKIQMVFSCPCVFVLIAISEKAHNCCVWVVKKKRCLLYFDSIIAYFMN